MKTKITIATLTILILTQTALAQRSYRNSNSASSCTCVQTRVLTHQPDGTQSVCLFQPFAFPGASGPSFQGGWHMTGDLVSYDCSGGVAGSGRRTYGNSPSPLCTIVERVEVDFTPGLCVHQKDTNHDDLITTAEETAWRNLHLPVSTGSYAGKASEAAIRYWDLTFSLKISGSDLCDPSRTAAEVRACKALPFECRRLNFVNDIDPELALQIKDAYRDYSNSLEHCSLPGDDRF